MKNTFRWVSSILFEPPFVEYMGEMDDEAKNEFLGGAKSLLFPVRRAEPFSMVIVEAMTCGTPVVAFPLGSVSEVVDEGITGFLVHDEEQAVSVIEKVAHLDRGNLREIVMQRFLASRMAQEYVEVCKQLMDDN